MNPQLVGGPARRMPHPDVGQVNPGMPQEDPSGASNLQDRASIEMAPQAGNGSQQNLSSQGPNTHILKSVPSSLPQQPGASPQQQPQQVTSMASSHTHHFPSAPSSSQSSRPKTPNRASPRPYHHPLTPTNRPPSTEPSEINLSPERLNASIAGLFPPKINIPLPPRQLNQNRGFDQQGLNPTTLKAIGQAPPGLTSLTNNNNSSANANIQQGYTQGNPAAGTGGKQDKQPGSVQAKRASPSNSRRSSPASNRKAATPSPGRQKGTKNSLTSPPHQQPMASSQAAMANSSVLSSPTASMPSVGTLDPQQSLNPLQTLPTNSEIMRDGQVQAPQPEQRQTVPTPRDPFAHRMASPRVPSQEPKSQENSNALEQPPEEMHRPQNTVQQERGTVVSPAFRDAPTSLNQLLDNSSLSSLPMKPPKVVPPASGEQVQKESPRPLGDQESHRNPSTPQNTDGGHPLLPGQSEPEQKAKVGSMPSPNLVTGSSTNPLSSCAVSSISPGPALLSNTCSSSVGMHTSSSASPNTNTKPIPSMAQTVLQRPTSSGTTPPNQITVFVTSNTISSAASTVSAVPPGIVSTVLAVPSKNIRPPEVRQPASTQNRPPQFITTPVFINPIFQVPASSVPSSTNVVSQPVMVGPIQMSANIQLTHAPISATATVPASTHSPTVSIATSQPGRTMIGQIQVQVPASQASQPSPISTVHPPPLPSPGAPKQEGTSSDASKSSPIGQPSLQPSSSPCTSPPFQQPLASPPACSSPGVTSVARRSPISSIAAVKNSPLQSVLNNPDSHQMQQQQSIGQAGKTLDVTSPQAGTPRVVTSEALSCLKPPPVPVLAAPVAPQPLAPLPPVSSSASAPIPTPVPTSVSSSPVSNLPSASPSPAVVTQASSFTMSPPSTTMPAPSLPPPASVPVVSSSPLPPPVEMQTSTVTETVLPSPTQTVGPAAEAQSLPEQPAAAQEEQRPGDQPGEGAPSVAEQGDTRASAEKAKGPSRRSSRAEKDPEEEMTDNGQRKRAVRPGSASSNAGKAAESNTGASPTQAKRRKSK